MPTSEYVLESYPQNKRSRELWLQHAAGFIIFEDVRQYAINEINPNLGQKTKEEVIKGINNAIYGLMMVYDGVTGGLENSEYSVNLETKVKLISKSKKEILDQSNLFEGDGMCMGYHGWLENDFGEDPIASKVKRV